ncbi:hypothetical protein JOD64_005333 [Micromonospora luteifusca]|uniref:Uncharacterized protein n=1 Tax=Micromonospora luteifusca TaxID=709860 RepID=A0ABS2M0X9_9ACTN|nr:hypothetical protein [Micromonospora luteifusca]
MPGGQYNGQRFLGLFTPQVQLGGQPATRAAQGVIGRFGAYPAGRLLLQVPLLRAPAACWCTRAIVEPTDTSQAIRPAAAARPCNVVRIRAQVPSRCQRRNNAYAAAHEP